MPAAGDRPGGQAGPPALHGDGDALGCEACEDFAHLVFAAGERDALRRTDRARLVLAVLVELRGERFDVDHEGPFRSWRRLRCAAGAASSDQYRTGRLPGCYGTGGPAAEGGVGSAGGLARGAARRRARRPWSEACRPWKARLRERIITMAKSGGIPATVLPGVRIASRRFALQRTTRPMPGFWPVR